MKPPLSSPRETFETSHGFPATRWSVIGRTGSEQPLVVSEALDALYRAYSSPVYAFLRRSGRSPQDAQDWTQSFFVYVLEHRIVAKARQDKGRFRSFLLETLKRFLSTERRKIAAQKRGGGIPPLSLDDEGAEARYALEATDARTPEHLFEMSWARAMLARAGRSVEEEFTAAGKQDLFMHLQPYLQKGHDGASYAETAAVLGKSEDAIKSGVQRLRQRFQHVLRYQIAQTVQNQSEVEDELRHLRQVLTG